jgi:hypothetical protein
VKYQLKGEFKMASRKARRPAEGQESRIAAATTSRVLQVDEPGIVSTPKPIKDSLGAESSLAISTENIGIGTGTANPRARLEVNGNITLSEGGSRWITVSPSPGGGNSLSISAGDASIPTDDQTKSLADGGTLYLYGGQKGQLTGRGKDGDVILTRTNSEFPGNVGIGKNDPGEKLDVAGTAKTTGLTVTGDEIFFEGLSPSEGRPNLEVLVIDRDNNNKLHWLGREEAKKYFRGQ